MKTPSSVARTRAPTKVTSPPASSCSKRRSRGNRASRPLQMQLAQCTREARRRSSTCCTPARSCRVDNEPHSRPQR
eukprot:8244175-Alexandrium_andersonii.AAC.1